MKIFPLNKYLLFVSKRVMFCVLLRNLKRYIRNHIFRNVWSYVEFNLTYLNYHLVVVVNGVVHFFV